MKTIILLLLLLIATDCAPTNQSSYKKKHTRETNRSYQEKKGLMILENTQLDRNKYMRSQSYKKKMRNSQKKYKPNGKTTGIH